MQIDRDNFNDVMARIAPGLNLKVDNTLAGDGSQMGVNLKFRSMDDFDPAKVAEIIRLPADHVVGMLLVIGKRARDAHPRSGQLAHHEVVFHDRFPDPLPPTSG